MQGLHPRFDLLTLHCVFGWPGSRPPDNAQYGPWCAGAFRASRDCLRLHLCAPVGAPLPCPCFSISRESFVRPARQAHFFSATSSRLRHAHYLVIGYAWNPVPRRRRTARRWCRRLPTAAPSFPPRNRLCWALASTSFPPDVDSTRRRGSSALFKAYGRPRLGV